MAEEKDTCFQANGINLETSKVIGLNDVYSVANSDSEGDCDQKLFNIVRNNTKYRTILSLAYDVAARAQDIWAFHPKMVKGEV